MLGTEARVLPACPDVGDAQGRCGGGGQGDGEAKDLASSLACAAVDLYNVAHGPSKGHEGTSMLASVRGTMWEPNDLGPILGCPDEALDVWMYARGLLGEPIDYPALVLEHG